MHLYSPLCDGDYGCKRKPVLPSCGRSEIWHSLFSLQASVSQSSSIGLADLLMVDSGSGQPVSSGKTWSAAFSTFKFFFFATSITTTTTHKLIRNQTSCIDTTAQCVEHILLLLDHCLFLSTISSLQRLKSERETFFPKSWCDSLKPYSEEVLQRCKQRHLSAPDGCELCVGERKNE